MKKYRDKIKRFVISDLSDEMLKQAKYRLKCFGDIVEYKCAPAEQLGFKENEFDGVYVSGSMHHFSDPYSSILQMKECLKPKGVLIICEPIVTNPYNFIKAAITKEEWGQFIVTPKFVEQKVKSAGFQVHNTKVLHYKSNNRLLSKLIELEKNPLYDKLAVMFIITSKNN